MDEKEAEARPAIGTIFLVLVCVCVCVCAYKKNCNVAN